MLVVALVGVNLSLVAAVGAYFFLTRDSGEDVEEEFDEGEDGEDEEGAEGEGAGRGHIGPLVSFDSMVVNLRAPTPDHYLKLTFQIELRSEEDVEHVSGLLVVYRDQVLAHLSALDVPSVVGTEAGTRLRTELLEIARRVFGRRRVRNIYFTELLVQ
jgi:flagellar basal body-associated protein FliL